MLVENTKEIKTISEGGIQLCPITLRQNPTKNLIRKKAFTWEYLSEIQPCEPCAGKNRPC